jgi:hypothetical protein
LKVKIIFGAAFLLLLSVAQAKDVSLQQTGYNNALQKMDRAEVDYKSDAQSVTDTEKLIERKNKQLVEEQKKAELSKAKYLAAKEQLEQAQAALDKAWKD